MDPQYRVCPHLMIRLQLNNVFFYSNYIHQNNLPLRLNRLDTKKNLFLKIVLFLSRNALYLFIFLPVVRLLRYPSQQQLK